MVIHHSTSLSTYIVIIPLKEPEERKLVTAVDVKAKIAQKHVCGQTSLRSGDTQTKGSFLRTLCPSASEVSSQMRGKLAKQNHSLQPTQTAHSGSFVIPSYLAEI